MNELEERIKYLSKKRNRLKFLERLYETSIVPDTSLPYACIEALDFIISEFIEKGDLLEKNVALLRLDEERKINPCTKNVLVKQSSRYELRFFNKLYCIRGFSEEINDCARLSINVDRKLINIVWTINGANRLKKYEIEDFLYCSNLNKKQFLKASGATLKRTGKQGNFKIGGDRYTAGASRQGQPIIIFFEKGIIYPFDIKAEQLKYHQCK